MTFPKKFIQKYFIRKILLSYDPRVPWRHHLDHKVESFHFKNVTSAKLWALRSTNCLFLKSKIKYLSNDGLTVLISQVAQNLWAFLFTKFIKIMTSFHKKYWHYRKNDPTKQILTFSCVLRVTILIFQYLANYVKDFMEGRPVDPPSNLLNLKRVQLLWG